MAAKSPRSQYSPRAIINAPPEERTYLMRRLWLPAVLLLSLAAGGLTGIIAAYRLNYSRAANEVAALATYRPSVVTRVYADDGETVIGEFALEKRIPLKYEEIPPVLKNNKSLGLCMVIVIVVIIVLIAVVMIKVPIPGTF